jgi:hypothetical protein
MSPILKHLSCNKEVNYQKPLHNLRGATAVEKTVVRVRRT